MYWDTKSFTNNNNTHMKTIFGSSSNITIWNSDLSNLVNGAYMFGNCPKLTTFTSDLPKMTSGDRMFFYSTLESFTADLSSLTSGY